MTILLFVAGFLWICAVVWAIYDSAKEEEKERIRTTQGRRLDVKREDQLP